MTDKIWDGQNWATHVVTLWASNDADVYHPARKAGQNHGVASMAAFLCWILATNPLSTRGVVSDLRNQYSNWQDALFAEVDWNYVHECLTSE
jgi:hypothetical protein